MTRLFDNITEFVKDDLKQEIKPGSSLSIAAARIAAHRQTPATVRNGSIRSETGP